MTLQDDDELYFTVGANETWCIDAVLFVDRDGSDHKIKYAIDIPSGSLKVDVRHFKANGSSVDHEVIISDNTITTTDFPLTTLEPSSTHFNGLIKSGVTGGTVKIRWTADRLKTEAINVQELSYLRAYKVN